MSTIDDFYNKTFTVRRIVPVSGQHFDTYQIIGMGLGNLQAVQDTSQLLNAENWGKEFWLFCEKELTVYSAYKSRFGNTTQIVPNDILIIDGYEYGVQGVSEFEDPFEDTDQHLKIVLERKTSQIFDTMS